MQPPPAAPGAPPALHAIYIAQCAGDGRNASAVRFPAEAAVLFRVGAGEAREWAASTTVHTARRPRAVPPTWGAGLVWSPHLVPVAGSAPAAATLFFAGNDCPACPWWGSNSTIASRDFVYSEASLTG